MLQPLVKQYKTAATYVIAREIEKRDSWRAIAHESDDWPTMRKTLKQQGLGEEHWLRLSIFDKDIDCRILTMLIRERYDSTGFGGKKKKAKNKGQGDGGMDNPPGSSA